MPLTWLVLLAGWSHLPTAKEGRMPVVVQSPQGATVQLTERSKMRDLDQGAFMQVLQDGARPAIFSITSPQDALFS